MSDHGIASVSELLREIKSTQDDIMRADQERVRKLEAKADRAEVQRIADEMARKSAALQSAVESLSRKLGRPGGSAGDAGAQSLRESARGLLEAKFFSRVTKASPDLVFNPTEDELTEAEHACRAFKSMLKVTSLDQLPALEKKALTSFSLGSSGFIMPPEMSARILSCVVDPSDVSGLMSAISISGPAVKFLVDDVRVTNAAWACETSCFANNPQPQLTDGLAEIEIKAETIRYIACTSSDILEDSAVNIENWMFTKVSNGFRATISNAVMVGDGVGKPLGILHSAAGIARCETAPGTAPGTFTWQDLISLKFQVPLQFHKAAVYLCNQATFGLLLTMSDALARPLMIAMPTDVAQYYINGSPVRIVSQMPDCLPGACPVLFGDLQQTYMIVSRKSTTMLHDPYSSGFCHLFKFEARVGGGVLCPNAARLLLIK